MSFLRHREIYQVETGGRGRNRGYARTSRLDESPVGYSLAGCSPAEPASASPTGGTLQQWRGALQLAIRCFLFTTLSRGLTLGAHPTFAQFTWLKPGVNEIEGRKNSTTSWLRRTLVQRLCQYLDDPPADKSSLRRRDRGGSAELVLKTRERR